MSRPDIHDYYPRFTDASGDPEYVPETDCRLCGYPVTKLRAGFHCPACGDSAPYSADPAKRP